MSVLPDSHLFMTANDSNGPRKLTRNETLEIL